MSRPLPERLKDGLGDALLAALPGFGLALLLSTALFGQVSWIVLGTVAAVTALTLCLLKALSPKVCGIALAAGLVVLALGCANIGPLAGPAQAVRILWIYPDLMGAALPPYREVLSFLIPILLTALCAMAVLIDLPTLTLLPMALFSIFFGTELIGNTAAPALIGAGACVAAYLLALARERTRLTVWPMLVVLLAVALAYLFMPRALPKTEGLREAAEEVYQTVSDYLPSNDDSARSGFTLETEGYLPLGSDTRPRLGGPADPSDRSIMEVRTEHTLYLRGVAMNSYNGLNWDDTLSSRRFLYADLLQQGYRRTVFDEYLPLTGTALNAESASVHMLSAAATTLYVPQRLRTLELRSGRMTPYFNAASELFLTRELTAGDGYAFTYLNFSADSGRTARLVDEAAAVSDTRYAEIAQIYTALPPHMQEELYRLSVEAAGGEESPYRRALAVRDYLRSHYNYALDVSNPPDNVDFASWFLLREKRGYCTYFATALTILCRMQGIPARYVTGYVAVPENGLATVTSADAHAWTEIYLNGFGWLTLDATPGHEDGGDDDRQGEQPDSQGDGDAPTPSPEPEATATPEPEGPTDGGSDESHDELPTPTPAPQATETPEPEPESPSRTNLPLLLIFILLALVALLLALSVLLDPARRARRHPRRAADILMAAVNAAVAKAFRPRKAEETMIEYYNAAAERFPELPLSELAEAFSARLYGRRPLSAALPERVWLGLKDRLSFPQRVVVLVKGVLPGKR